ncbi:hypothetical protein [Granulicella sibirica]|uniref:Uncharacterized protein n=1 Tax=Granulicella sibirica TaxID=2479048 RepID=A0A4Q0SVY0_9BACT|nr:hypothetical protein [Granulicella sibirica]RXH54060.1 hypothetical protein GRAN_5029 [Granulicella sibirica]
MQLQAEYERWTASKVDASLTEQFPGNKMNARLKRISSRLRKDPDTANFLERLTPAARLAELTRRLRREVAQELRLSGLEEWSTANPQGDLF